MIPDDEVERVREAADIVGIIGESVPLKRSGGGFRGPCPFHQGKNPNFSVDPGRRLYHCFKCGESGDVFTFLRRRYGMDWPDAVRMVAEKSGLTLREVAGRQQGPDDREPIWEVNAAASAFFLKVLHHDPAGRAAREYLSTRNFTLETAERFGIGFAPAGNALRDNLAVLGFDDSRLIEAGLLVQPEGTPTPRPRFRTRLMFPIHDIAGNVAGFGGRVLGQGEPKYLNSPETRSFAKGKLLYGLNWARNAIRRADRVVLVEGYFDLVRLAVAGIEEVVAPLGTALTPDQTKLLSRYTRNIFLLYDSDSAGLKATFRSGDELLREGFTVRVVTLPRGEDPDTVARDHGRDGIERHLSSAVDVMERKIQLLDRNGWFRDLPRRRRAIDHLLTTIRAARDPVTRDLYVGRVSEATGVDRQVLAREVTQEAARGDSARHGAAPAPASAGGRPRRIPASAPGPRMLLSEGESAERELVRVMLTVPGQVERITERIGPEEFRDARYREIFEKLLQVPSVEGLGAVAGTLTEGAASAFGKLMADAGSLVNVDRTVSDSLAELEKRSLRSRNAEIQRLLAAAAGTEKDRLLAEKQANAESIRRLSRATQPD